MRQSQLVYVLFGMVALGLVMAFAAGAFLTGSQRSGGDAANSPTPQMPVDANAIQELVRARKLEIVDEAGMARLTLKVGGQTAILGIADGDGKPRAMLLVGAAGETRMMFLKADGTPQIDIFTDDKGGQMTAYASQGKGAAIILTQSEGGGFAIKNQSGKLAAGMLSADIGGGMVTVANPAGVTVATVQSDKTNSGRVTVHDVNGELKNWLTTDRP
jgi:hypothetical protein